MSKLVSIAVLLAMLAVPAVPAVAALAPTWVEIGSGKTSSPFAVASARGNVNNPQALRLGTQGRYNRGTVTVVYSCKRVLVDIPPNRSVTLTVEGSDSCNVIATGSMRSGNMTVKIEARK